MSTLMEHTANKAGSVSEGSSESVAAILPAKSRDTFQNLPNELYVYREDVVTCSKSESMLGVVMEVAGDSDSDSDSDDSFTDNSEVDGDEQRGNDDGGDNGDDAGIGNDNRDGLDENVVLAEGQVRVMWIDGSETTNSFSDLNVVDRGFLHGDIVSSYSDPTGQLGLVVNVNIFVDLLTPSGEEIKYVSTRDLKRIREFIVGDHVLFGPWLGRVNDVLDNVTVLFDDGSVCKVIKADHLRLKPVSRNIDGAGSPYYPGQRVRAVSSSVFKSSRWLSGHWKANRLEGTVMKVQAGSVFVYWIASANPGFGDSSTVVPAEEQNPKNLTLLSCFSHTNWELGDWCFLPSPLPFASSTCKTSTVEDADHLTKGCRSDTVSGNVHHYKERSLLSLDVPALDLKDQEPSDSLSSDVEVQNGQLVSSDLSSTEAPDNSVSGQLTDDSCMNSLNGNVHDYKSNDLMDFDRASNVNDNDKVTTLDDSGPCSSSSSACKESIPAYRKRLRKVFFKREKKIRRRDEQFERAFFIINTMTKVDVAWQDGTTESGLDAKFLIPFQSPGDREFFPEQYVVEKTSNEGDDFSEVKRVGVVRSMNAKERTACVRWLKPVSRPEEPREFDNEEVVSAYELDEHPDYDYCYGDVVVRLSPILAPTRSGNHFEEQEVEVNFAQEDLEENSKNIGSNGEQKPHKKCDMSFSDLTWVGHITGLQDGDIEVTWANGMVSKVGPQAVYVVGRDDDGESFNAGSEVDDSASWETVDEDEMPTIDAVEEEADLQVPANSSFVRENSTSNSPDNYNSGGNGPLSLSLAALGFITRLATGLFSRGLKQTDQLGSSHEGRDETGFQEVLQLPVNGASDAECSFQKYKFLDDHLAPSAGSAEESNPILPPPDVEVKMQDKINSQMSDEVAEDRTSTCSQDGPCGFKHFDITNNPLDHYFLGRSDQNAGGRKWAKKVQQEWTILERNLPDAIYVRVFEDRMDLLRAVIIGACGTPYQDGIFFFDFHLPPEYPQVPPSAYYHSGGLRINPNLYEDGKVCLSLLNTWTGKGNEVWDASSSSILQVLVSLQGLVLNSKPYFNEAGYDKQVGTAEGEKNSLSYNENTFLLNLRSMLYLLRRPPMHFEEFVSDHFRRRGYYILKACDAYMRGCMVGLLTKDACTSDKSGDHPCSVGFKLMLAKILLRLFLALREVGADCREFEHLQSL